MSEVRPLGITDVHPDGSIPAPIQVCFGILNYCSEREAPIVGEQGILQLGEVLGTKEVAAKTAALDTLRNYVVGETHYFTPQQGEETEQDEEQDGGLPPLRPGAACIRVPTPQGIFMVPLEVMSNYRVE